MTHISIVLDCITKISPELRKRKVGRKMSREDKIEMEDNSRTAILFRKAEQVDPKEKEKLLDILDSTIDIFLGKNNNG